MGSEQAVSELPLEDRASQCPNCWTAVIDGPHGGFVCSHCGDFTEPPTRVAERKDRRKLPPVHRYVELRKLVQELRETGALDP